MAGPRWQESSCYRTATFVYPERRERKLRNKLLFRMLVHHGIYRDLMKGVDEDPLLQKAVERRHTVLVKPFRPYVTTLYSRRQRLAHLLNHYRLQAALLGMETTQRILAHPGITLASFPVGGEAVDLALGYRGLHDKEGELMLCLLDPREDRRIYSTAFSFAATPQGGIHLCLGTIQGNKRQSDWIKQFARDCFGLRPHAFMLEAILMLARQWGLDTVRVVDNAHHVYRAKKKTAGRRRFDLDELVTEYSGSADGEGWLALPSTARRKALDTIPSKKRAMYRKRYAWLDGVEADMAKALAPARAVACQACALAG